MAGNRVPAGNSTPHIGNVLDLGTGVAAALAIASTGSGGLARATGGTMTDPVISSATALALANNDLSLAQLMGVI